MRTTLAGPRERLNDATKTTVVERCTNHGMLSCEYRLSVPRDGDFGGSPVVLPPRSPWGLMALTDDANVMNREAMAERFSSSPGQARFPFSSSGQCGCGRDLRAVGIARAWECLQHVDDWHL